MNLTIADSIAIKVLNKNALLVGVGNELHLHTRDPKTTNLILPVKLQGKVHGIEIGTESNQDKLLVYGEKEFVLLQWTQEYDFNLLHRGRLTDWISTGKFMMEAHEFVLLTAHSIALRLEYLQDDKICKIAQRSSCSDKSTLYCAALHGERWLDLVCFGGNAFGELLLWQPSQTKAPLLQRIPSHNGVIFSINYNSTAHMLTTTSDDRSIRFWRVEQHSKEKWADTKLIPLASGFGHVARVFQGRIVKCDQQIYAITVGEDSYICVWRTNGELIHKYRQQFGAIIWNFDYVEDTKTIYTVGSTGNVLAFELQDIFKKDALKTSTTTILPALSDGDNNKAVEHYVAKIKFLTLHILVGITNQNILVYNQRKHGGEWRQISDFDAYKCTVLEVFDSHIAICGFKRLTLYKFNQAEPLNFEKYFDDANMLNGVVRAFKFLAVDKYLICDEAGNCLLLHELEPERLEQYIIELPKCKEPWLTSAALIDMQYILISNRQGNIFLYKWCNEQRKFQNVDTLKHPHGNLGATLIKLVHVGNDAALFKSAGHDGSIKFIKLCKISSKLRIVKREIVPVAWVELLEERHNDCDLLLGFNDNHFAVWSKLYDFILQLPCGGGHRCWDYCINAGHISLVFIQNKQVLLHKLKLFNNSSASKQLQLPARNMWHVKPCNVLVCIEEPRIQSGIITISAGDDNLIKISRFECTQNTSPKQLIQLNEIHTHISNVRALKVLKYGSDADYLIFSGGGRAQLCISKFNLKTSQVEELLNFTVTSQSGSTSCKGQVESYKIDPETRIMTLDILLAPSTTDSTELYEIFVGCSDGFVRKYQLNTEWQIKPLAEIHFGRCILQLRLVDSLFLLVAATDGIVKFSNLQMTHVILNLSHHASGINALDTRYNAVGRELQLLTGGDDQDLVYSRLSLAADNAILEVLETRHFSGMHTAQVTAAQLSCCGNYAFSSGVDQQIFKINLLTQQVIHKICTCVADVKGLQMCASDEVCFLYGCGLQVISVKC